MKDREILEIFPSITSQDLAELREDERNYNQATDTEGDVYVVWYSSLYSEFMAEEA